MTGFWTSFLDGFTGAGFARKLGVPGDPIPGFAPVSDSMPELVLDDYRSHSMRMYVRAGKASPRMRVLEFRLDVKSGKTILVLQSDSGEVKEEAVETNRLPANLGDLLSRQTS